MRQSRLGGGSEKASWPKVTSLDRHLKGGVFRTSEVNMDTRGQTRSGQERKFSGGLGIRKEMGALTNSPGSSLLVRLPQQLGFVSLTTQ